MRFVQPLRTFWRGTNRQTLANRCVAAGFPGRGWGRRSTANPPAIPPARCLRTRGLAEASRSVDLPKIQYGCIMPPYKGEQAIEGLTGFCQIG